MAAHISRGRFLKPRRKAQVVGLLCQLNGPRSRKRWVVSLKLEPGGFGGFGGLEGRPRKVRCNFQGLQGK